MKEWKREEGAVALVEASILLPITFLAVFLLLFFSLQLFSKSIKDAGTRRLYAEETQSETFLHPEEDLESLGLSGASLSLEGLFFPKLQIEHSLEKDGGSPYRFFQLGAEKSYQTKRSGRRGSSTNLLWKCQAINGYFAKP